MAQKEQWIIKKAIIVVTTVAIQNVFEVGKDGVTKITHNATQAGITTTIHKGENNGINLVNVPVYTEVERVK